MTPVIRAASTADAGALAAIHAACFSRGWCAGDFEIYAADPACFCLLAEGESGPAGFILCRRAGGEAEILTLAVHPVSRGRGIARKLCARAIAGLRALGAGELHLEVDAGNAAALALYERLGFTRAGLRRGYYRSSGGAPADAVAMRLTLV